MKKFNKVVSTLVASMMAASMIAGCGADTSATDAGSQAEGTASTAAAGSTFKIGAIGPLTGEYAAYGSAVCNS